MLDVSIRTELLRLMLDLRAERGLTYLFITHDLSLAWVIADRIAVMYLGKIMEIGPAEQVIRSPRTPVHRRRSCRCRRRPAPPAERRPAAGRSSSARRRTRPTSRPAAGSTRAARSRSTAAGSRSRRCSTSGAGQAAACWLAEGGKPLPVLPSRTPAELVGVSAVAVASTAAGVVGTGVPAGATATDAATGPTDTPPA